MCITKTYICAWHMCRMCYFYPGQNKRIKPNKMILLCSLLDMKDDKLTA